MQTTIENNIDTQIFKCTITLRYSLKLSLVIVFISILYFIFILNAVSLLAKEYLPHNQRPATNQIRHKEIKQISGHLPLSI